MLLRDENYLLSLLGRERLSIPEAFGFNADRVLITGAGGSIGSAIARRLAGKVSFLGCIGHSEAPIFKLKQDLDQHPNVQFWVRDIGHEPEEFIKRLNPDLIIHAAAHKHVGLMEDSPEQAFLNNTQATIKLATAAYAGGVKKFVFISTDKAANPTSVMGASKRLAEAWCLSRAPYASVCRFGNVAGSSGSLIEIVHERLAAGKDLVLTHEEMTRYFITPDEAVDLVMAASCAPGLYTLDMGDPVKILDIMTRMANRAGRISRITISQPGSGEKLEETLFNRGEVSTVCENSALLKVKTVIDARKVAQALFDTERDPAQIVKFARAV
jgi:FlaA1/EpsC-like NDP-sugar epimerase